MKYQNTTKDNKQECTICPRYCKLQEGQKGFCKAYENIEGRIESLYYGKLSSMQIDPVEKKPLFHFYPNTKTLSLGTLGCNLGCKFCQNYSISQTLTVLNSNYISPEIICELAKKYNCDSVSFTYNEPVVFIDYVIDTSKKLKENDIKTILVSAGYLNPKPREDLFEVIDACNIDLKGFNEKFYNKNCLAKLNPVLETIKYIKNNTNTHIELTTLIIEDENNSEDDIKHEVNWILENICDETPLHFTAFFPTYKMKNKKETSLETIKKAVKIAYNEGLKYVYGGNVIDEELTTTFCHNCKKPLISRENLRVNNEVNIDNEGKCVFCGTNIPGVFQKINV